MVWRICVIKALSSPHIWCKAFGTRKVATSAAGFIGNNCSLLKDLIISIAIGYPDWDFPANKVYSEREPIENITTWCGI